MEINLENQNSISISEINIGFQIVISPSVEMTVEGKTTDEILGETKAKEIAMTKFPSWVKIYYVRRIRELDCFESIREMLLAGMPVIEVARQIHEMNEVKDLKLDTLKMYLEHYKATIPTWMMAARQQPKQYLELKQKADEGIDCLKEMTRLYHWMKERLEIGMAQERRFGILSNGMDRNFVVASQLLQLINELKEKLGLSDDQARVALPKHLSDQVEWNRIYSRESVQQVMSSPEKRSRVVQAAERLLDLWATKLNAEQIDKLKKAREPEVLPANTLDEPS